MKNILAALCLLCVVSLSAQQVTTIKVTVKPYKSLQNYEHFKRFVLNTDQPEVEFISGFDFEWGYTYVLKVKQTDLGSRMSDGTRYEYALSKVISKTPVEEGTTFNLFLDPKRYYYDEEGLEDEMLKATSDSTYMYGEQVEIIVPEKLRTAVQKIAVADEGRRAQFTFAGNNRIRLVGLK